MEDTKRVSRLYADTNKIPLILGQFRGSEKALIVLSELSSSTEDSERNTGRMLKFIPPVDKTPRYASFTGGTMKVHTKVGHAKQSLRNRSYRYDSQLRKAVWNEGFILQQVDGTWYILYHVPEGTEFEDLPWVHPQWVRHGQYYSDRRWDEPTYRPEEYKKNYVSRPMTRDEYADWRVKVELERRGIVDGI